MRYVDIELVAQGCLDSRFNKYTYAKTKLTIRPCSVAKAMGFDSHRDPEFLRFTVRVPIRCYKPTSW